MLDLSEGVVIGMGKKECGGEIQLEMWWICLCGNVVMMMCGRNMHRCLPEKQRWTF